MGYKFIITTVTSRLVQSDDPMYVCQLNLRSDSSGQVTVVMVVIIYIYRVDISRNWGWKLRLQYMYYFLMLDKGRLDGACSFGRYCKKKPQKTTGSQITEGVAL
jgi:hypothetical protein